MEFILSSLTAWDSLMDAVLDLAQAMRSSQFRPSSNRDEQELAWAQRAARDVLSTVNLMLIHEKVAKALFFGSSRSQKRSNYPCSEAKGLFRNGAEGFAPEHIDRNQTVQANRFQFTSMLSYWHRTLVDSEDSDAFIKTTN